MDKLKQAIKEKGYSITGFCNVVLNMQYRTFKTQLDKQSIRMRDINKILDALGKSYEDLFK